MPSMMNSFVNLLLRGYPNHFNLHISGCTRVIYWPIFTWSVSRLFISDTSIPSAIACSSLIDPSLFISFYLSKSGLKFCFFASCINRRFRH